MRRFALVDVFTHQLSLGNPVAVVLDGDGATDAQMQAFARWTNLSETTFVQTPADPSADYRLRIFTTQRELPFAGHPTLGSARAWLDAGHASRTPGVLVQECGAGLVELRRFGTGSGHSDTGSGQLDTASGQLDDRWGFAAPPLLRAGPLSAQDVAEVAAAIGVDASDVVDAQWADNGPGWVAVLLRSAEQVLALRPRLDVTGRFRDVGVVGPYPDGGGVAFEVRAFILGPAGFEDPVTGSLNAALGQWLIPAGRAPMSYVASQGTRLGRRGRVHVELADDRVWVSGHTVVGVRGEATLPAP